MEIALFIAQDNPARALIFVDELEGKCNVLGASPGIGTQRPELGYGVLMLPYGRYLIFYRDSGAGIRVERILHGARDVDGDDFSGASSAGSN